MTIFLIGFMGCGKSTLGRQLADLLNYTFTDLDDEIVNITGKTIPDLFAVSEEHFRIIEADMLRKYGCAKRTVIATGGGTPCFFENMGYMNNAGLTVYLKAEPKTLAQRILTSDIQRPLMQGLSMEGLWIKLAQMLEKRIPFYNLAKMIIDADLLTPTELALSIDSYLLSGKR